jgi:hypothetical protein
MTSAEVDVPGIGNVKKEYVVGGVALVAGIGGYAWWKARQGSSGNAPVVLNPNDVVPASDYQPSPTGNATQNVDQTSGALTTNAKWTTYVVEKLATYGFDPTVASASLGKWISRSSGPYSATDVEVIQRAIGLGGYPPEGGPWTVPSVTKDTPTPTDPGTVEQPKGLPAAIPGAPWKHTTALPNETWYHLTERVFGFDRLSNAERQAKMAHIASVAGATMRINLSVGVKGDATGPVAGQTVWYR